MGLSKRKLEYVEAHFRRCGDAKIAKVLGVDKDVVRKALKARGWERTDKDKAWIRNHPDASPPAYTGQIPQPADTVRLTRRHVAVAALCAIAAFLVYLRTVGPTVTGEDSGELVTAAYTMGVAHPPGYPLWCILGKLFTLIIPLGTVAWRVNVMSAFFAASTVFVVCLLGIKLRAHPLAAAAGALALAFSKELWEQATIAEVYTLNAFLVATCVLLLFVWYESRRNAVLYVFALVYGLGLCNHNTMHFLAPPFVLFVLAVDREPWRRWRAYGLCVALAGLAWCLHLYLPLRARTNPPVNWGNPSNWESFWDVIRRKQYSFGITADPRTPARLLVQTWHFAKLYAREFTPWLLWAPLLGIPALWRKEKLRLIFLAGLAVYVVFGFIFILNFDIDKQSLWLNNVFWIPAYMIAAVLIGCGVHWLAIGAPLPINAGADSAAPAWRTMLGRTAAVVLGLAVVLMPLQANYYANDKSQYYFAYDYGLNILNSLDQDAIYFPSADHATFPAIYLRAVEGVRPDVTIANKYGYPEKSVYEDMDPDLQERFRKVPTKQEEKIIEDWVIANTDRPVYFTKKRAFPALPGATLANRGLVYRVVRPGEELAGRDYWSEYVWHTLDPNDTRGEFTAELVLGDYHYALGRHLLESGEADKGLEHLARSLDITGETKEGLNNIASACAEHGQRGAAEEYYARALDLDREYVLALANLAKLRLQDGRPNEALPLGKRLLRISPGNPEAHRMVADCYTRIGLVDAALAQLHDLSRISPRDPKVFRDMGMLVLNHKNDPDAARALFGRSLELNPNQPDLVALASQPSAALPPLAPSSPWDRAATNPDIPLPSLPGPHMPQLPSLPQPGLPPGT